MSRTETVLEFRGVTKSYRRFGGMRDAALRAVDLKIGRGEVLGIVGPNGAGKTTLLRLAAGTLAPDEGSVVVAGQNAGSRPSPRLVGFVPEPPVIPPELTGTEWLRYLAAHRANNPAKRLGLVRSALELGAVARFAHRRVGEMSRGMVNQLALAGATISGSRILVLDETLSNIDPLVARSLRESLASLAREGRSVIIASHDLGSLERIATTVAVLCRGGIVAQTSMASLLAERVAEVAVEGGSLSAVRGLSKVFPRARMTGAGIAVPLRQGLSLEGILAVCRSNRIAVAGSRVRYRILEDLLLDSVEDRHVN